MVNKNMVRKHGRKEIYFSDINSVSRFIKMYKDLFIESSWTRYLQDRYVAKLVELEDGKKIWKLIFLMKHDDMRKIEKDLGIKKKKFRFKYSICNGNRSGNSYVRFVC